MLNKLTIQGRLTRDPELKYTTNQNAFIAFPLAVERDAKGADGTRATDFIYCTAWRSTAEFISKYFHKGDMAIVSGRLQSRKYTDKSGADRVVWEVLVENIYFGGNKKTSSASGGTAPADVRADDFDDGEPQDWRQNTPPHGGNEYQSDGVLPF